MRARAFPLPRRFQVAINNHEVIKPQVIVDAAVEAVKDNVSVINTVTRKSFDEFKGVENETIQQRVEGTLPVRTQGFRHDRTKPLVMDEYRETFVNVTVRPNGVYSGVGLTDEQKDWDFGGGWGRLFNTQTSAIVKGAERDMLDYIEDAPYEYRLSIDNSPAKIEALAKINRDVYHSAVVKAKQALKRMGSPAANLVGLVGSNVAEELMVSNKLVDAQARGLSALDEATLGRIAGVPMVEDLTIGMDDIFIYDASAFIFYNAAPSVPDSVPFGATANDGGISLRWIKDYDSGFSRDRSIFSSWVGHGVTLDNIEVWNGTNQSFKSKDQFFLRGAHLRLGADAAFNKAPGDGSDDTPGGAPDSYLAKLFKGEFATEVAGAGDPFPGVMTADGWGSDTVPAA